ncbi:MAG: lysophospholipase [Gammaproteobacteria bacterium]|nr:lysophospholipase [Gammaproteobacteria bacterium]
MAFIILAILILIIGFWMGPRLHLDDSHIDSRVPLVDESEITKLADWINEFESAFDDIIPGTAAHIQWADPDTPRKTPLSFLYIHGFSATWKETHPVTSELASRYNANVLQARIAGHGMDPHHMRSTAREWLQSMRDCWDISRQIGERVVVVATSTGAPLSVWLTTLPGAVEKLHAFLFMAPNFKTRVPIAPILTWPWAKYWVWLLIGKTRRWVPENEAVAKYWTYEYSTQALMEMQSVVDWFQHQDLARQTVPLAVMVMKNDPTISPAAAINGYESWGAEQKALLPVEIDGDAKQHVFVGDIMAPHRTKWVVDQFDAFLKRLGDD